MKRIAWLTDIHLNVLPQNNIEKFCRTIAAGNAAYSPDVVVISGDIAEAASVAADLEAMAACLRLPIYFVLGNHDFYGSSIANTCEHIRQTCRQSRYLRWLSGREVYELTPTVGLVGDGLWADGRSGDYQKSELLLNDYFLIEDLAKLNKQERWEKLKALGDAAAQRCREILPKALAKYRQVFFISHVPPFRQACFYLGKPSDGADLAHFCCQAAGEVLRDIMTQHPQHQLIVLSGHTHECADVEILPNLRVLVGSAEYGDPVVQYLFEIE